MRRRRQAAMLEAMTAGFASMIDAAIGDEHAAVRLNNAKVADRMRTTTIPRPGSGREYTSSTATMIHRAECRCLCCDVKFRPASTDTRPRVTIDAGGFLL